uniref:Uncharacterized protein n=1 Tax=Zea mays TaxID=4577 RepID=A0A804NP52_MAIZE
MLLWNICRNFRFPNAVVVEIPSFRVLYRSSVIPLCSVRRHRHTVIQISLRFKFQGSGSYPRQIFLLTWFQNIWCYQRSNHFSNHAKNCMPSGLGVGDAD